MENINKSMREAIICRRSFTHLNSLDADVKRLMYQKSIFIQTLLNNLQNYS